MPLILAVEPDRRQASHIVAVLRGRPRTELVIAESAAAALQAIAARVPDLLLASPLLSRQDEARLATWLRSLGPAAAHVQALTIPILATAAPETTRGMLSVLRRRRPRTSSPAGCEPAMFASQVGLYLDRASRERVDEPAATVPPKPAPEPAPEWPAAAIEVAVPPELTSTIEADPPELAVVAIEADAPEQIDAVSDLAALRANEDTHWVAVPFEDPGEAPAAMPEPAPAEPVTDDVWMLTPAPEVDELVAAAPADPPDTAPMMLLTPIYDLPPEPVVEAIVAAPAVDVEAPAPAVEAPPPEVSILAMAASKTRRGMLSLLRRRRPRTSSPAGCEPARFASQVGLYLERASRERVDDPAATVPPEPLRELAPEPPAAAVEPDPKPAIAEVDTAGSNRIEAVTALAPLPAKEDSRWVAVPIDEMDEEPARLPEPAPEWSAAEIEVGVPPELPSAIEADPPEPAVVAIEADAPEWIDAEIALAALRAHEAAQWVAVPLEDLVEGPVAMPEPAAVEPVTDDVWVLTPVTEVEELVTAAPADPPDMGSLILLTPIYDLPPEPEVKAIVIVTAPAAEIEAPAPEVVSRAPEVLAPAPATTRRRKAAKPKTKPVQDEWGLFDPSQCGFAALLDKLDEITAQEMAGEKRDDVEVRVISY